MFLKEIEKLENENEKLRQKIRDLNFVLGGINQRCTEYQSKNCAVAHVGFGRIKELSILGLDLIARKEE